MTRQKELGYELGNVLWHNLEGYKELWNKAEFDTKEKIINELGELAIKLTIPAVVGQNEQLKAEQEAYNAGYNEGANEAATEILSE